MCVFDRLFYFVLAFSLFFHDRVESVICVLLIFPFILSWFKILTPLCCICVSVSDVFPKYDLRSLAEKFESFDLISYFSQLIFISLLSPSSQQKLYFPSASLFLFLYSHKIHFAFKPTTTCSPYNHQLSKFILPRG